MRGCLFHIKRRYTFRMPVESVEFVVLPGTERPCLSEYESREAWACTMCSWASLEHVVHDLRRGLAMDPGAGAGGPVEFVGCSGCDLVVMAPDGMPDYAGVARLWAHG